MLLTCAVHAPAQIPLGTEFRVDTLGHAFSSPHAVNVAVPPDGDFVIAWEAIAPPLDHNVFARRFGTPGAVGPEFLVNTFTTGLQFQNAVDIDDAGNFTLVWLSDNRGIVGQRFAASGIRRGAEFEVAGAIPFVSQVQPDIAVAPGGGFVAVWSRQSQSSHGIVGQRYDSSGVPLGTQFQVNSTTTNPTYQQQYPSVAVDRDGNYVVVWVRSYFAPAWVLGRRFAADGTPKAQTSLSVPASCTGVIVTRESPALLRVPSSSSGATGTPMNGAMSSREGSLRTVHPSVATSGSTNTQPRLSRLSTLPTWMWTPTAIS